MSYKVRAKYLWAVALGCALLLSSQAIAQEAAAPAEQTPAEQVPAEQVAPEQVPSEQAVTEQAPAGQIPAEQVPAVQATSPEQPAAEAAPAVEADMEFIQPVYPETLDIDLGGGVTMSMVLIQPGTFRMGSATGRSNEKPDTDVVIAKPFYMGKYELTQRQWQAVISLDPMETMARGVIARMEEAQAGNSGPVPTKEIEKFVAEQWKAVVGEVTKISPPVVVMSKAAEDQWGKAMETGFDSLQTEVISRTLAEHWKAMGVNTLARMTGEQLVAMNIDPKAVTVETVNKILAEQWAPTMGSDPVEMIAKASLEKVKAAMGNSKMPISAKKATSIVEEQWKSVMDADPYTTVPLAEMGAVVAEYWKKAADEAAVNVVKSEDIQKVAAEQWKSGYSDKEFDAKADAIIEKMMATLAARPQQELVEKTKKAMVKKWQSIIEDKKLKKKKDAAKVHLFVKAADEQWAGTMAAVVVDKYAGDVTARWKTIPGADPSIEMARIFFEEWKASSGVDASAVPIEKIEKTVGAQWKSIMGSDPIVKVAKLVSGEWKTLPATNSRFDGDDLPMDTLSWRDGIEYVQRLSCMVPGKNFHLPTEAEWEYACRAGTTTEYSFGDDPQTLGDYAWFKENSDGKTHPGGEKRPSPWGLYDMYGNLAEWCLTPYLSYPTVEGDGGKDARILPHTVRGGFWGSSAAECRSAFRMGFASSNRHYSFGCRIAITVK